MRHPNFFRARIVGRIRSRLHQRRPEHRCNVKQSPQCLLKKFFARPCATEAMRELPNCSGFVGVFAEQATRGMVIKKLPVWLVTSVLVRSHSRLDSAQRKSRTLPPSQGRGHSGHANRIPFRRIPSHEPRITSSSSPIRMRVASIVDQSAVVLDQDLAGVNARTLHLGDDVFGPPLRWDDDDVDGFAQ
jgi:hypothetical protein